MIRLLISILLFTSCIEQQNNFIGKVMKNNAENMYKDLVEDKLRFCMEKYLTKPCEEECQENISICLEN